MLGRIGRRDSLRALSVAHELGIKHLDTARSYGWGEAESMLGDFLATKPRDQFTLVTKCGILPAKRSNGLAVAKAIARRALQVAPASAGLIRRAASAQTFRPTRSYDTAVLRQSVETSLRQLRTDYVDVLLLHNYATDMEGLEDILAFFQRLTEEGKVLRYGISIEGDLEQGMQHLAAHGALPNTLIQAPLSEALLQALVTYSEVTFIAHSPFRAAIHTDPEIPPLRGALRTLAAHDRCEALVTSMFSPDHIRANVQAHAAEAARVAKAS